MRFKLTRFTYILRLTTNRHNELLHLCHSTDKSFPFPGVSCTERLLCSGPCRGCILSNPFLRSSECMMSQCREVNCEYLLALPKCFLCFTVSVRHPISREAWDALQRQGGKESRSRATCRGS